MGWRFVNGKSAWVPKAGEPASPPAGPSELGYEAGAGVPAGHVWADPLSTGLSSLIAKGNAALERSAAPVVAQAPVAVPTAPVSAPPAQQDNLVDARSLKPPADPPPPAGTGSSSPVAGGPSPFDLVTTGRSSTSVSSELAPADAARLMAIERGIADEQKAVLGARGDIEQGYAEQAAGAHKAYADQLRADLATYGDRSSAAKKRVDELSASLDRGRRWVDQNPVELLKGYDTTSRALLVITAALEGTNAALSRRPAATGALLQVAVDRDLAAQRSNLEAKLQQIGMDQHALDNAMARWDGIEERKRTAAMAAAQQSIAAIGAQSSSATVRLRAAEAALSLDHSVNALDAKLSAAARGKTSTTIQKAPLGALAGKGDGSSETSRRLGLQVAKDIATVVQGWDSFTNYTQGIIDTGSVPAAVGAGKAASAKAQGKLVAQEAMRAISPGVVTGPEAEAGLAALVNHRQTKDGALQGISYALKRNLTKLTELAKNAAEIGDASSVARAAEARQEVLAKAARLQRGVNERWYWWQK